MKSIFYLLSISCIFGIITGNKIVVPAEYLLVLLLVVALELVVCVGKNRFYAMFALFIFCCALFFADIEKQLFHEKDACPVREFTQAWAEDTFIRMTGTVNSFAELKEQGRRRIGRFEVDARQISVNGVLYEVHEQVLVSVFGVTSLPVRGQSVRIYGQLVMPKQVRNRGVFDYGRYLERRHIHLLLQAFGQRSVTVLSGTRSDRRMSWSMRIEKMREHIRDRIRRDFTDPERRALALSLIIGDQKSVSPAVRDDFTKTGTVHILAISGSHITIFGAFLFYIFRFFRITGVWRAALTSLFIWWYSIIAGGNIPIVRAVIMAMLCLSASLCEREHSFASAITLALMIILFYDPMAVYSIGMQLSFASVLSLALITPLMAVPVPALVPTGIASVGPGETGVLRWQRRMMPFIVLGIQAMVRFFAGLVVSSCAVLIGVVPLMLFHFHAFSTVSVLANCGVIPVVTAVLFASLGYMGTMLVPFLPSGWIVWIIDCLLRLTVSFVSWCASFPWVNLHFPSPHPAWYAVYYGGLIACVWSAIRWQERQRHAVIGMILWFFLFLFVAAACSAGTSAMSVTVFDGKKLNAVLVQDHDRKKQVLINSGASWPYAHARWIIVPYLRSCGINRLHVLVMTEVSRQVWGGLGELMTWLPPRLLIAPQRTKAWYAFARDNAAIQTMMCRTVFATEDRMNVPLMPEIPVSCIREPGGLSVVMNGGRVQFLYVNGPLSVADLKNSGRYGVIVPETVQELFINTLSAMPDDAWRRLLFVVVSGRASETMKMFVSERVIPYFDTDRCGMLVIRCDEKAVCIDSFLCGRVYCGDVSDVETRSVPSLRRAAGSAVTRKRNNP